MALNHLVFTDHGTFRVKADKMTPSNEMLSLYAEGKLVASFNKDRVIGVGIEQHLPDYRGVELNVVGKAPPPPPPSGENEADEKAPTPPRANDFDNDYLPKQSQ